MLMEQDQYGLVLPMTHVFSAGRSLKRAARACVSAGDARGGEERHCHGPFKKFRYSRNRFSW